MICETALILAGGLGTRLRAEVADRPKPLADIGGRPFITYLLDYWIGQGIRHFVLAVSHRWEMIADVLGDNFHGASIHYSVEPSPLGTGGGLILALQSLDATEYPVFVINGDTLFTVDAKAMLAHHVAHNANFTVACRRRPNNRAYGSLLLSAENDILDFNLASNAETDWINGGIYLFDHACMTDKRGPVSLEHDLIPDWLAQGLRGSAYSTEAFFIDIGIPADYRRAVTLLPVRPWVNCSL